MKKYIIILLFTSFIACEDVVDNPNLPYIEQIVVRAVLEHNKPVTDVKISRTLPPIESYSDDKAIIQDAIVYITYNNIKYLLNYNSTEKSYFNNEIEITAGGEYKLDVTWKNLKASAKTFVPEAIIIDSFTTKSEFVDNDWYPNWETKLFAHFRPKNFSSYVGYTLTYQDEGRYYFDICYRTRDTLQNGNIVLPVSSIYGVNPNEIKDYYLKNNIHCYVDCYDEQFYKYFITRYDGDSDNSFFGTSGNNMKGNIIGGIGMFIGVSRVKVKIHF